MFLALIILVGAGRQILRNSEFETKGSRVVGTVENKQIESGNSKQGMRLRVQYRYVVNGVTYTQTSSVRDDTYGELHAGGTVPIIFLPDAPSDSCIDLASEREHLSNRVWLLTLIGLPAFAFAAFIYFLPSKKTHA